MRLSPNWQFGPAAVLAAVMLIAAISPAAVACSITPDYKGPTIEERTQAADYVIVGWVTDVEEPPEDMGFWHILTKGHWRIATVEVKKWLKGSGPDVITVTGFGSGVGDCMSPVPEDRAIMFLVGDSQDELLSLKHLGVYDAVIENNKRNRRQIRALASE